MVGFCSGRRWVCGVRVCADVGEDASFWGYFKVKRTVCLILIFGILELMLDFVGFGNDDNDGRWAMGDGDIVDAVLTSVTIDVYCKY